MPLQKAEGRLRDRVARRFAAGCRAAGVEAVVVACSGGGDSTALLHLVAPVARAHGVVPVVAHLDHASRAGSGRDAAFVAEQARALGLEVVSERRPVEPGPGFEARARAARRAFLARLARERRAAVALGHTRDDQAETVLLHLARGAGLRGLAGMAPVSVADGVSWLRPLLGESRAGLRSYLRALGVPWREDPTNLDLQRTRNRLRHEVLPALADAVPGAVANIARAAEILRGEEEWLAGLTDERLAALRREGGDALVLDAGALAGLPRPLARRVVRRAAELVRGDPRAIALEHVDAVLDAVLGGRERARDLPGVRVRLNEGLLRFTRLAGRREVGTASDEG